nr:uncharacterized protein LOC105871988 isoform X2 [Microcebus murinus]
MDRDSRGATSATPIPLCASAGRTLVPSDWPRAQCQKAAAQLPHPLPPEASTVDPTLQAQAEEELVRSCEDVGRSLRTPRDSASQRLHRLGAHAGREDRGAGHPAIPRVYAEQSVSAPVCCCHRLADHRAWPRSRRLVRASVLLGAQRDLGFPGATAGTWRESHSLSSVASAGSWGSFLSSSVSPASRPSGLRARLTVPTRACSSLACSCSEGQRRDRHPRPGTVPAVASSTSWCVPGEPWSRAAGAGTGATCSHQEASTAP